MIFGWSENLLLRTATLDPSSAWKRGVIEGETAERGDSGDMETVLRDGYGRDKWYRNGRG
jgi:hypothetical protein